MPPRRARLDAQGGVVEAQQALHGLQVRLFFLSAMAKGDDATLLRKLSLIIVQNS
jgi:hypothetical protein